MESGVRDLKKSIETICRTAAVDLVRQQNDASSATKKALSVTKSNLTKYLGRPQIHADRKLASADPGIVTGLPGHAPAELSFSLNQTDEGKETLKSPDSLAM